MNFSQDSNSPRPQTLQVYISKEKIGVYASGSSLAWQQFYIHTYTHTHMRVHTHAHIYTHACMHVHTHICMHVHIHTEMLVHACACVHDHTENFG